MVLRLLGLIASLFALALQGELVIAKEGTGLYHRPGCEVIRDFKDVIAMTRGQAEARGYKPHPQCDPANQPPPGAEPGEPARPGAKPPAKPAPISVYVDATGNLYHRQDCRRLGKTPKKILLDAAAAKKYWPCGTCKPPILPRKNKKPWIA